MTEKANESRRNFLYLAAGGLGGVAAAATAVPFIGSMFPAADTLAASKTEFDVATVAPGQLAVILWQGKPVFVVNRTEALLKEVLGHDDMLKDKDSKAIPEVSQPWMTDENRAYRAIKPQYLVSSAVCTHLGCIPGFKPTAGRKDWGDSVPADWPGGWHCPCHGSKYDISGRVINGSPAPFNLHALPYEYKSDTVVVIG